MATSRFALPDLEPDQRRYEIPHDAHVRPRKHVVRKIVSVLLVIVGAYFLISVAMNPRFHWDVVAEYMFDETVLSGLRTTLLLTLAAAVLGMILGTIVAIMRLSPIAALSTPAWLFAVFFRGTPELVQILFWYNIAALYPTIFLGIPGVFTIFEADANALIAPLTAGLIALSINEAAYMSEIIRSGIIGISKGQTEAAEAVGMPPRRILMRIILPQAMRTIIPPMGNEIIGLLKATALVSMIAIPELLFSTQVIYNQNLQVIPLLIVASVWYLVVTSVMSVGQYFIERHFGRGSSSTVTPLRVWWSAFTRRHAQNTSGKEAS